MTNDPSPYTQKLEQMLGERWKPQSGHHGKHSVLYRIALDLLTECTALRVTEDNLRQELQECQDQRRAAFRRIEELDAMREQTGQGVPVAWGRWEAIGLGDEPMRLIVKERAPTDHEKRIANWFRLYTHPAPQQKPLTDEQIKDCLDAADQMYCLRDGDKEIFKARAIEAAHGIRDKK